MELLKEYVMKSDSVFLVLFVSLFAYVLKENNKREKRLQSIIKELSEILHCEIQNIHTKISCLFTEKK